jgi:hypothetical protein
MWNDPIVEETRRLRDELASRFDYDLEALSRYLRERDAADPRPVVDLPPRAPETPSPVRRAS